MKNKYIFLGALFMMTGVILGAFGAHALKDTLTAHGLDIWKTAVLYQFVHGLALLSLSAFAVEISLRHSRLIYLFFGVGVLLFSGSLYMLATISQESIRSLMGPLTPIGGMSFIIGWGLILWNLKNKLK